VSHEATLQVGELHIGHKMGLLYSLYRLYSSSSSEASWQNLWQNLWKKRKSMRLTFYGATQEVPGSMHLVEVNGKRILLECGLYQGPRAETYTRNLQFPFDVKSIDVVIISHAHIDHVGNLPNLVSKAIAATYGRRRRHAI